MPLHRLGRRRTYSRIEGLVRNSRLPRMLRALDRMFEGHTVPGRLARSQLGMFAPTRRVRMFHPRTQDR